MHSPATKIASGTQSGDVCCQFCQGIKFRGRKKPRGLLTWKRRRRDGRSLVANEDRPRGLAASKRLLTHSQKPARFLKFLLNLGIVLQLICLKTYCRGMLTKAKVFDNIVRLQGTFYTIFNSSFRRTKKWWIWVLGPLGNQFKSRQRTLPVKSINCLKFHPEAGCK